MIQLYSNFFIIKLLYGKSQRNQRTHAQLSGIDHINAQIFQFRYRLHIVPAFHPIHIDLFFKGKLSVHTAYRSLLRPVEDPEFQLPFYIDMIFCRLDFLYDHLAPLQDDPLHIRLLIRYISVILQGNLGGSPALYAIHMYCFLH